MQAIAEHPDWGPLPDPEVMMLARVQRRAIVTNNVRDFRPPHADAVTPGGVGHFGMLFMAGNCKRPKDDTGRIVADLAAKLAEYPGEQDLANAEDWL